MGQLESGAQRCQMMGERPPPRVFLQGGVDGEVWRRARQIAAWLSHGLGSVLIALIQVYQWTLSPLLGSCCRFEPSCSRYMSVCIQRLGPLRGGLLGLRRLARCHPFCPGGHDPPPEVTS